MALIDVVKWEGSSEQFVWKYSSDNLRYGTQLVVKPGQWALFMKSGEILDLFTEGTYTLASHNLPILTTMMSLPFGGNTPFQAEVWFVNKLSKLNNRFGTPSPLQVEDPKYGLIVPVRAFGMFGFCVKEPKLFLTTLTGTARVFGADKITEYFRGRILSGVSSNIGRAITEKNVSIVQIVGHLDSLSEYCRDRIEGEFAKYGLALLSFYFESINIPETDASYIKLKQIKEKAAELNVIGRDVYQYDRSMDVLKTAAGNEGAGSGIMQAGIGLGMGAMVGNEVGRQATQMVTHLPAGARSAPPPIPPVTAMEFFIALNNQQLGPFPVPILQQMSVIGTMPPTTLVWRQGMPAWQAASGVAELMKIFQPAPAAEATTSSPPPIPPSA